MLVVDPLIERRTRFLRHRVALRQREQRGRRVVRQIHHRRVTALRGARFHPVMALLEDIGQRIGRRPRLLELILLGVQRLKRLHAADQTVRRRPRHEVDSHAVGAA